MNERMSTKGAEDMLASIRRLVADEVRPEGEGTANSARLLLTAALRVDPKRAPAPVRDERVRPLRSVLIERRARTNGPADVLLLSEDLAVAPPARRSETLRLVSATPEPAAEPAPPIPEPQASAPEPTQELMARLAALETLLDAQQEPYDAEEALLQEDASAWFAHRVTEAAFIDLGLGAAAAAPAPEVPSPPAAAPASALTEESALRAMIRDVLREELDGPMGERVTRNLRKLIRSELSRAFAARGLT